MNWQKTDVIVNKINALYKSMSMAKEAPTSIEKDLMLNYIRALYEEFLMADESPDQLVRSSKPKTVAPKRTITPDFEVVDNTKLQQEIKPETPVKPPKPKIIEVPESLKDFNSIKEPYNPIPKEAPRPAAPPVKETQTNYTPPPPPKTPAPKPRVISNKAFDALFEFKSSTELADRLGERPINDLTKSLSINDRLLFMNQLFGKDMNELDQSLQLLNRFESLSEAKGIISTLAEQHNWMDEEKIGIAKDFVRLVRRRYL